MKTYKNGWGFIHYGNSGDVEFINFADEPNHKKLEKKLRRYDKIVDNIEEY